MLWIVFTAVPVLIAVILTVLLCKSIAGHRFKCVNCSGEFRIKWTKVLTTPHTDDEYILKCPYCHKKGPCVKQRGQD